MLQPLVHYTDWQEINALCFQRETLPFYRWLGWGVPGFWKLQPSWKQNQGEGLVPEGAITGLHRLADILKTFLLQGWKSKKGTQGTKIGTEQRQKSNNTSNSAGSSWGKAQAGSILKDSHEIPLQPAAELRNTQLCFFSLSSKLLLSQYSTVCNSSPQFALWPFKLNNQLISKHNMHV